MRLKTIISPVPEEDEDDLEDATDDLEVQEVKAGQEKAMVRLPVPPHHRRYRLSRSNSPGSGIRSPVSRSLSPCENVPRHFTRPEHELYPVNLRRYISFHNSSK